MSRIAPHPGVRRLSFALMAVTLGSVSGCATAGPAPVAPGDIPELEQMADQEPGNGSVHLRLGAAYLAAGRCDQAVPAAERGRSLEPDDPAGPLVVGQCLEEAGRYEEALDLYASFIERNRNAPGVGAVEGRRVVALRRQAQETARTAIENEATLVPAEANRVGVLPFIVDGDSIYQPLQVGLANMLTTDLALLQRFPMVERVQTEALLEELRLPPELVDPATAARTGRLLQASQMVLGTVSVPDEGRAQLSSNIVLQTGELVEPFSTQGTLQDILELEKELAIRTAEGLGYQLTDAEIQRIRQNIPLNLPAFMAFSRGLMAEDLGDFDAAAAHYAEALRADPGYGEAAQRLNGAVGADVITTSGEGEVMSVGPRVDQTVADLTGAPQESVAAGTGTSGVLAATLNSSILDLASHQAERATVGIGTTTPIEVVMDQPFIPPSLRALILITIVIPR